MAVQRVASNLFIQHVVRILQPNGRRNASVASFCNILRRDYWPQMHVEAERPCKFFVVSSGGQAAYATC